MELRHYDYNYRSAKTVLEKINYSKWMWSNYLSYHWQNEVVLEVDPADKYANPHPMGGIQIWYRPVRWVTH